MLYSSGFMDILGRLPLPVQGSNRGYDPLQLLVQFAVSVWCGASRYARLDVARFDYSLQRLFGWDHMPEHKAFQRYFNKINMEFALKVFGALYHWFFSGLKFDSFTMDIDSSVLNRYGDQQGAKKGYNKHKPGRNSPHPLIAFIADVEMVASFRLRPGDAHTANNFKAFLEETFRFIGDKKTGLLRLDSGFYDQGIFDCLEGRETPVNYIMATPMYPPIQRKIAAGRTRLRLDEGIEIMEFEYRAADWASPWRKIAVRQKIKTRSKATGKQLSLFAGNWEISGYGYSCYVTNLPLPPAEVWRLYLGRASCENRIKELKYDYGQDKMNGQSFDGTEASLILMTVACNFMSLFEQLVIGGKTGNRLSTIRYKLLAIPSTIKKSGNGLIVTMALQMQRRAWIKQLWKAINESS
jgi:hypothetical protein